MTETLLLEGVTGKFWRPATEGEIGQTGAGDLQHLLDTVNAQHRCVYDALADEYAEKSPRHFVTTQGRVDRVIDYLEPGSEILDVGCGVGLALSMLAASGHQATGVDVSARMAEFARKRSPHTDVVVGDFLSADLPVPYDAIWEQALLHLFPRVVEHVIFERFRELLRPGGVLSLSTTVSSVSGEGWNTKTDYGRAPKRYRRVMTESELLETLRQYQFDPLDKWVTTDPMGKNWLTVVGRKLG